MLGGRVAEIEFYKYINFQIVETGFEPWPLRQRERLKAKIGALGRIVAVITNAASRNRVRWRQGGDSILIGKRAIKSVSIKNNINQ